MKEGKLRREKVGGRSVRLRSVRGGENDLETRPGSDARGVWARRGERPVE